MRLLRRNFLLTLAALAGRGREAAAAGAGAVAWREPVELARGPGVRGPWQQNDSRFDFVDDPAVVLAADGTLVVAWVDQARKAVLVQRRRADGSADGEAVEVDRLPRTFSWMPRLAMAPDAPGAVFALWQEIVFSGGSHGGEMMLARSDDGGRSFSPALNLSRSPGGDGKGRITPAIWHNGSADLLAAGAGVVCAAWTEYDGPLWFARSTDGARTFGPPQRVAGGRGERAARAPSLAQVHGALLLAWTQGDDPAADIHVARSANAGAAFERPVVLRTPGYSDAPRLAADAAGVLHLAWGEGEGGPFTAQRILHARSRDGGRSFDAPRPMATQLPAGFTSAGFPSLAVDGRGGVAVLAELQQDARQRSRALGIAVSRDGGERFGAMELVPHSRDPGGGFNGSSQGQLIPKLALNGRGDLVVVNSALREGSHSRVWMIPGRLA